jgi:anaerobic ribonucleoside-triphosphate reductase
MKCSNCGAELKTEQDKKRGICFKCHVSEVKFGFKSTGYGRSNWNESTIRETQRMYEAMPNVEKISTRKELI